MLVAVVRVREVRMGMSHRLMTVGMGMPDTGWHCAVMRVLMVHIVLMLMRVLERLVGMRVHVSLGHVQPYAGRHQRRRKAQLQGEWIAEE